MRRVFFACIVSVLVAGWCTTLFAQTKKVSIATLDFPPISDPNAPGYGFVGELFKAIFQSCDYSVDINIYPWARGFQFSKAGQVSDGIFPSIYRKEREEWFIFSDPIITSGYVLITRKNTGITTYKSLYDFKDMTIGVLRKGITGSVMDSSDFKKEEGKDFETNLHKLLIGRFELITGEYLAIMNLIHTKFADRKDELVVVDPPISKIDFYLMVSRNSPDAAAILTCCNQGIAAIKQNGLLEKIKSKYGIR